MAMQQLRACFSTTFWSCACASLECVLPNFAEHKIRRMALIKKPRAGGGEATNGIASVRGAVS
jgi:hypothetical protein